MSDELEVEAEIRGRINKNGRITFSEFMNLALFWPRGGYYSDIGPYSRGRDFYTSPGVHPAFASLLAIQLFQMWRLMDRPRPFWAIEIGAGEGLLSHDFLNYVTYLPKEFQQSLHYICIDVRTMPGLEDDSFTGSLVDRLVSSKIPLKGVIGCVISNELVDSFPVHRVSVLDDELHEIFVTLDGDGFKEEFAQPSTVELERRLRNIEVELANGHLSEINLGLDNWICDLSNALESGYVITIDYGGVASEIYSEARKYGTLTCFYHHSQTDDPYLHIGNQDITSQVDFSSLTQLGSYHGLENIAYLSQGQFLSNLGIRNMIDALPTLGLNQTQLDSNRMAMLDLIKPGGLGDFKVLIQSKSTCDIPLWGTSSDGEIGTLLGDLPVPQLTSFHIPLLGGRYPHLSQDYTYLLDDLSN